MKIFRNRTVIGVLCILLALIICFGVTPLFSRSASEKTEIVRVTKDIKEGDEITAEMVQTVEVGAYNLPQNLMTDKKEVVGKYATADLAAGDYILSSKLSAVPAAENAYLYNLDGKKQAISVTIKSFATGLSGKLESGDTVLFSALSVDQAHRAGKEKAHEHSQTHRLHHHVHHTGHAYGGAAPADGVVPRDRSSGQRQERKRRGCRGVGIPASGLSRSRGLFSPQPAPYARVLRSLRRIP